MKDERQCGLVGEVDPTGNKPKGLLIQNTVHRKYAIKSFYDMPLS